MDPACSKLGVGLCGTGHYVSRQAERRLTVLGRRLSARSTPALTEHRKNAMLIAPTATEIRTFISRPSVPHSSIFPATRQGQAADAVTALAVAHRRRPPSLEILCVPPLRAFTEKIEHCLENLLFSCPVQKSILSTTPLLKDANVGDFLHIASARLVHTPLSLYLETGNRLFRRSVAGATHRATPSSLI